MMSMKNILIPLMTFLAGAGVGFLVTRKIVEKKYAALAEEEIASVKEAFARAKQRKPIIKNEKPPLDVVMEEVKKKEGINPNGTLSRSSLDGTSYDKAKTDYTKMYKEQPTKQEENKSSEPSQDGQPCSDDEPEEEDDEDPRDAAGMTEEDNIALRKVDRTVPYVIDDQEFADGNTHYDKISLYYYRVDDVLCEENQEVIDDIDNSIGYDAMQLLDMQTTIWVRNERIATDYEVISLNSSYAETVHGVKVPQIRSPRERYLDKQKHRRNSDEAEE